MVRAARQQSESGIYHVVVRGVGQCIVFEDDQDRRRYLEMLDREVHGHELALYAWCLMDNHVHLLAKAEMERLSGAMRRLGSGYAVYFNTRHARVGHLFQGRFKSEPVDTDEYFLTALRYVHQNPVRAGLCRSCGEYPWSSYREYVDGPVRCDTSLGTSMLGDAEAIARFHEAIDPQAGCIDLASSSRSLSTEEALEIARAALGKVTVEGIPALPREARDAALRQLKQTRLSLRQIERLTGVSKSLIARA